MVQALTTSGTEVTAGGGLREGGGGGGVEGGGGVGVDGGGGRGVEGGGGEGVEHNVRGAGGEDGRVGGGEGGTEGGRRERISSCDRREMNDTLTPLAGATSPRALFTLRRGSTLSSLYSTSSSKREKPPPLLRSEPLYVVRISVRGITALPNVQANEISLRASVGRVELEELLRSNHQKDSWREQMRREGAETVWEEDPVIRARVEVGAQVQRFNLPPSALTSNAQDTIVMISISGMEAALLLKNVSVLKDFFDDEFEADAPIPIQLHVRDTSLVLRESPDHTPHTDSTMNVAIKSAQIHRGPRIEGTNLFPSPLPTDPRDAVPSELDTLRLNPGQVAMLRETSPAVTSTGSSDSVGNNPDLLQTFRSFIHVFESHVRRHGGLKVQLNQPDHIAGLLQELQVSLREEEMKMDQGKSSDAPPSYSETVGQDENTTLPASADTTSSTRQPHTDSSQVVMATDSPTPNRRASQDSSAAKSHVTELRRLRLENQELARMQAENEDLISQLTHTKILLAERSQDLDEVTSECKKAKDDLVTHKQVLENYQEHIERLLTENADLKVMAMTS